MGISPAPHTHRRLSRLVVVISLITLLFASSACAYDKRPDPRGQRPSRPPATSVALKVGECPRDGEGLVPPFGGKDVYAGAVPAGDFSPIEVIRCRVIESTTTSGTTTSYPVEESRGLLTLALEAALKLSDTSVTPSIDTQCAAKAHPLVYLILVDANGMGIRLEFLSTVVGNLAARSSTA